MKLYFAPRTCSLSPAIILHELALPHQMLRVDNATKRTADGRDFLAINPKGYVAALELDNGTVLTEGPVIVQYLADLSPAAGLAPPVGSWERLRLQEWLNFISSELHAGVAPLFNHGLPDAVRAHFRARIELRMKVIESTLQRQPYLAGGNFSVADAFLYTVLAWFAWFDLPLAAWPAVAAWHASVAARPAVQAAQHAHG